MRPKPDKYVLHFKTAGYGDKQRQCGVLLILAAFLVLTPVGVAHGGLIDLKAEAPDYRFVGVDEEDYTGQTVVFGDVNGDGRSDVIVGARGFDFNGRGDCGAIYVLLSSDTLTSPVDYGSERPDLKRIFGPEPNAQVGTSIACGDIDNDGKDEILCGIPTASPNGTTFAGELFVIFGSDEPRDSVDLSAPPSGVTKVEGANVFDKLGESLAVADVNNDEFGDIIAGAPFATAPAGMIAGKVVVIYGAASLDPIIDLASTTIPLTRIFGANANDIFGTACHAAEVTGDEIEDIIAGAPQVSFNGRASAGAAYVIPGSASLPDTIDLSDDTFFLEASKAPAGVTTIFGPEAGALAGSRFETGDIDGDMMTDLFVAVPEASPNGRTNAGAVYVLNGAVSWPETIDLASPPAMTIRFDGPATDAKIGRSMAAADFNFDGPDDLVIGVPAISVPDTPDPRYEAGIVYIVFGRSVFPATIDLSVGQTGVTSVYGAKPFDNTGNSVAAGRVNDDGFDDLLIGANNATEGGSFSAGEAIVLMGSPDITPTQVVFYEAIAQRGSVILEWLLRDDVDPRLVLITRSLGENDGSTGEPLPSSDVTRLGPGHYTFTDANVRNGLTYTYTVATTGEDAQILFRVSVAVPSIPSASLFPNVPNPFRDQTTVAFEIPSGGHVGIRVFDVTGALIAVLADGEFAEGVTTLGWDGRNRRGRPVPSGVYFVQMDHAGKTLRQKMLIIR
ncbi:MAG: FG-GAP repeat protein [Candidatus Latescibacterota bacterium]|nr:MAG: FG-GAP repeat protein [Candidatus Latescibacterota bacterium]